MTIILTILNVLIFLFKSLIYGIKFVLMVIIEGVASIVSMIISLIKRIFNKQGGEK